MLIGILLSNEPASLFGSVRLLLAISDWKQEVVHVRRGLAGHGFAEGGAHELASRADVALAPDDLIGQVQREDVGRFAVGSGGHGSGEPIDVYGAIELDDLARFVLR